MPRTRTRDPFLRIKRHSRPRLVLSCLGDVVPLSLARAEMGPCREPHVRLPMTLSLRRHGATRFGLLCQRLPSLCSARFTPKFVPRIVRAMWQIPWDLAHLNFHRHAFMTSPGRS